MDWDGCERGGEQASIKLWFEDHQHCLRAYQKCRICSLNQNLHLIRTSDDHLHGKVGEAQGAAGQTCLVHGLDVGLGWNQALLLTSCVTLDK